MHDNMQTLSDEVRAGNEQVLEHLRSLPDALSASFVGALAPLQDSLLGPITAIQAQLDEQSLSQETRDALMQEMASKMDELNDKMDELGDKMDEVNGSVSCLDAVVRSSFTELITSQETVREQLVSLQDDLGSHTKELEALCVSPNLSEDAIQEMMRKMEESMTNNLSSKFSSTIQSEFGVLRQSMDFSSSEAMRASVQALTESVKGMEGNLGHLMAQSDQMQQSLEDVQAQLRRQSNQLNDLLVNDLDIPAIPLILPDPPKGMAGRMNPNRLFNKKSRLFFVCPITMTVASPVDGEYRFNTPKAWVRKAAPLLSVGFAVAKLVLMAGGLPLPIPSISLPPEMTELDYLDTVYDKIVDLPSSIPSSETVSQVTFLVL
jgi:uncharacterized protein YukE